MKPQNDESAFWRDTRCRVPNFWAPTAGALHLGSCQKRQKAAALQKQRIFIAL